MFLHPDLRGADLILAEIESLRLKLKALGGKDAELAQRDLRYWEARRATMQSVERDLDNMDTVGLGSEVVLRRAGRMQTMRIVGEDEADPAQGYLAYTAPWRGRSRAPSLVKPWSSRSPGASTPSRSSR